MIALSLATTFIGSFFMCLLYARTRQACQVLHLKKYRQKQAGLVDLLNYAALVDEGVIVGKNGALMAAWLYRGEDRAGQTEEAEERLSFRINQALSPLGNGWMIHVDAIRREAPGYSTPGQSHFPDPISKAVDEERRAWFERLGTLYEGSLVLTLTWLPEVLVQRRFVELMFDDSDRARGAAGKTGQLIEQFKQHCRQVESRLSLGLNLERLSHKTTVRETGETVTEERFLRHLQCCLTGLDHPVNLPKNPVYLDTLLGGQELLPGVTPKLGRQFIQCVAIEGFPCESEPGMLTILSQLPLAYRWSTRFIFMDSHEAVAHFTKYRKKWKQKVRGFFDQIFNTSSGIIDEDALAMVHDAAAAIAETNSGLVAQGYYTSVVVLMDEDRALVERAARFIEKKINALGFAARIETINTQDAFLGSLPGHGVENVRRPLINTLNLADLLPTSSLWTGENKAPSPLFPPQSPPLMHCMTQGNSPFRFNLHVRDLGHSILFGPSRAGKSTHLGLIALSWRRYHGARIYAFDSEFPMSTV